MTIKKITSKYKSTKDCINWKTKGKCRKMKNCPYRNDENVQKACLMKKYVKLNKKNGTKKKKEREVMVMEMLIVMVVLIKMSVRKW